ncbi:TPA: hypothetical protein ACGO92_002130 [Streptococcus suis]
MLLLFSPIFLLVGVLIACDTGFSVLFTQTRIGKDNTQLNSKIADVQSLCTIDLS